MQNFQLKGATINIRSLKKRFLTHAEELEFRAAEDRVRERIKKIDFTPSKNCITNSTKYAPPQRSYWPYIKAALDKNDDEFNKVVDSIFDGTFEFPIETYE